MWVEELDLKNSQSPSTIWSYSKKKTKNFFCMEIDCISYILLHIIWRKKSKKCKRLIKLSGRKAQETRVQLVNQNQPRLTLSQCNECNSSVVENQLKVIFHIRFHLFRHKASKMEKKTRKHTNNFSILEVRWIDLEFRCTKYGFLNGFIAKRVHFFFAETK